MALSRWTGSAFTPVADVRRWTGSAWQAVSFVRRWTGSAWVLAYPFVKLTNTDKTASAYDIQLSPGAADAWAGIGFLAAGGMEGRDSDLSGSWFSITPLDEWMTPSGADASLFEIRATTSPAGLQSTNTAGTVIGATTWSALSAGRRFFVNATRGSIGATTVATGDFTVEIREASTAAVLASCTLNLTATAEVSL